MQIKGEEPDVAVNGKNLYKLLMNIARMVDQKVPASGGICSNVVTASQSAILNQNIQYI